MKLKRTCIFLLLLSFTFCFSVTEIIAQKHSAKKKVRQKLNKKQPSNRAISLGVINGKAIDLVKPVFPLSAAYVGVRGVVTVEVLIDEDGNVVNTKALKGNPLLIPASLKAARKSKFAPVIIGGQAVRVTGVIVYHYVPDKMNWLEIGFHFDSDKNIQTFLPSEFDAEKLILIQAESLTYEHKKAAMNSAKNLIESRLSAEEKNLWLFSVGQILKQIFLNQWNQEQKKLFLEELEAKLVSHPNLISAVFITELKSLWKAKNSVEFNIILTELTDKLYAFGN